MTFFNKKEDIINIELTPYGRSLLSQGKLTAAYYAFYDDDILYDSEAAGFTETNNQIAERIMVETPRLRPQRDIVSVEGNIFSNEVSETNSHPHSKTKTNYLTEPLGTSDQTSDFAPSWKATMIQGKISGSASTYLTGSKQYLRHIPQIDCEVEYKIQIRNTSEDSPLRGLRATPTIFVSKIYPDGTYIELIQDQVLCQLSELEGFLFKDGIEIKAYLFDDTEDENLIPLKFPPKNQLIKNGILVDPEEVSDVNANLDPTYLDYYVDLLLDKEIPEDDICQGVSKLKEQDVQIGIEINCPDLETVDFDIYGSRIGSGITGGSGGLAGNGGDDVEICE